MIATNGHPAAIPMSEAAERGVIGAVLINPALWPDVAALVRPTDFYILRHQYIWQALVRLYSRGDDHDYLTVTEELRAMGKLAEIGGPPFLLNLVNDTPTSVHAETYARLVLRASVRRRLITAAGEMMRLAADESLATESALVEAERAFNVVVDSFADQTADHSMADMVGAMLDEIDSARAGAGTYTLPTGFRDLDHLLGGGFWRGEIITLAGRPGMGKTAVLLQIAINAARVGARVGVHSLEMNAQALVRRMAASETGINLRKLRMGEVSGSEYDRLVHAGENLALLPIMTNDEPLQTPESVYAQARRWQMRRGLDLIILDYIQILNGMGKFKGGEREREIAYFMRAMKAVARRLNIPIVLAAQINRGVESRENKRPMLSDLRESGSIEQESDIVAFLYRDSYYNPETLNPALLEVIVAKQRNGETGLVNLHYDRASQRISDTRIERIDLSEL